VKSSIWFGSWRYDDFLNGGVGGSFRDKVGHVPKQDYEPMINRPHFREEGNQSNYSTE
jgi:hypothetical protein